MPDAGYYAINYRALRVSELVGMFGLLRLPFTFFSSRFLAPSNAVWMPSRWAENECTKVELSERFWQAVEPHRVAFQRLGFQEYGLSKVKRHLNPTYRDGGGISFLDESRRHFGLLLYIRNHPPPPTSGERELITFGFTIAFERGSLTYTNNKGSFDPLPHQRVVRLAVGDPEIIYRQFLKGVSRCPEQARPFSDLKSLQTWFDETQLEAFQERTRRGLFVRLSDSEVEAARRKLPPLL